MEKLFTILLTLLLAKLVVNGTTTPNPRKPIFTSTPDKINRVLVGKNIKLEWVFEFHSSGGSELKRIRLYELAGKAKKSIASKDAKSEVLSYSPLYKAVKDRYICKISYEQTGIGKASIYIKHLQFNYTFDYGIQLQMMEQYHTSKEDSVSVRVVDMVSASKGVKSIKSWFGQRLLLKCDVLYQKDVKPLFKWYKKSTTSLENLFVPNNTRILVIEKVNKTDFGEYICEARSPRNVKVKQQFKIEKLGYAGSPRNFVKKHYPKQKSYALYWEQPSTINGHWVRKYILEEWNPNKNIWVKKRNLTTLHVTIKKILSTTTYRVCSANEIGYAESSCSKPIELGQHQNFDAHPTQSRTQALRLHPTTRSIAFLYKTIEATSQGRGKSNLLRASQYLIFVMVLLSAILFRN